MILDLPIAPALAAVLPGFADELAVRFVIDLACAFVLVRFIYYRYYRRSDLFLTFFSFNLTIFLMSFMLNRVKMSIGAAFGLFAVFSMLRYRTEGLSAKDMTYLFLLIALGLLMGVGKGGPLTMALIGCAMLVLTLLLESGLITKRELSQEVLYENVRLVQPDSREALIVDLKTRTGLDVHRVDIREIDFVKDAARLTVYYHPAA